MWNMETKSETRALSLSAPNLYLRSLVLRFQDLNGSVVKAAKNNFKQKSRQNPNENAKWMLVAKNEFVMTRGMMSPREQLVGHQQWLPTSCLKKGKINHFHTKTCAVSNYRQASFYAPILQINFSLFHERLL